MANAGPPVGEVRHIAKLNLLNWGSWRYGISILLERNRLFRVTLRQELRPAEVIIILCVVHVTWLDIVVAVCDCSSLKTAEYVIECSHEHTMSYGCRKITV